MKTVKAPSSLNGSKDFLEKVSALEAIAARLGTVITCQKCAERRKKIKEFLNARMVL